MARIRHALIMAAGRGQRMAPLTNAVAKPMAPYLDTTLVGHGIAQLKQRIPNIHITVGYKAAAVAQHVIGMGISSVINTDGHPNAWWIGNTLLSHLDEPILVLTCDNIVDIDLTALEDDYFASGSPACMLVPTRPVPGLDGDYIFHDDQRFVTGLSRTEKADKYCSGIQILNPTDVIRTTSCADFHDAWNALMPYHQLMMSSVFPDRWTAIDTMSDLARANEGTTP